MHLLARYRDKVCCYNDDIQGTAGIALAGMINAVKIKGGTLGEQRILFLGAGSAAIGLADLMASAMAAEGMTLEQAQARISASSNAVDLLRVGSWSRAIPRLSVLMLVPVIDLFPVRRHA